MQNQQNRQPPSFFDWYRAGIDQDPTLIVQLLQQKYPHSTFEPRRPSFGYQYGAAMLAPDGDQMAFMQYGGSNVGTRTLLESSGSKSHQFALSVRDLFPDHLLLRGDIAKDYMGGKADFQSITRAIIQTAKRNRVGTSVAGDWIDGVKGRTLYAGSRTSPVYLRCYEKGLQDPLLGNTDIIRLELEFKPKREDARATYATTSPEDFWGANRFLVDLTRVLGSNVSLQPSSGSLHQPTDHERSWHWMLKQYAKVIAKQAEIKGGCPTALGLSLLGVDDSL